MIEVQEAARAVLEYIRRFGELLPSANARLEEFDYDPSGGWTITMSFDDRFGVNRVYKTFVVSDDGKVGSMKIRKINSWSESAVS